MIKLRMQRIGRHKTPHYKIVAIDSARGPKSAKFIEELGTYNPHSGDVSLKNERVQYWISVGAQPSDTVHNFLISNNVIEGTKRKKVGAKREKKSE